MDLLIFDFEYNLILFISLYFIEFKNYKNIVSGISFYEKFIK